MKNCKSATPKCVTNYDVSLTVHSTLYHSELNPSNFSNMVLSPTTTDHLLNELPKPVEKEIRQKVEARFGGHRNSGKSRLVKRQFKRVPIWSFVGEDTRMTKIDLYLVGSLSPSWTSPPAHCWKGKPPTPTLSRWPSPRTGNGTGACTA